MIFKLKQWFLNKILKRKYIIGVDYSNDKDYGCKVEGYKDKNGITNIEKITYF